MPLPKDVVMQAKLINLDLSTHGNLFDLAAQAALNEDVGEEEDEEDEEEGVMLLMTSPVHGRKQRLAPAFQASTVKDEVKEVRQKLAGHVIYRQKSSRDNKGKELVKIPKMTEVTIKVDMYPYEQRYHADVNGNQEGDAVSGVLLSSCR
jgi:hypothetical protein